MYRTRPQVAFVVIMTAALALGISVATAEVTIFVDASATGAGNGSSWADAYTMIQPALNAAQPGYQVWVAAGRYVEQVSLKANVGLYGGFEGIEDPATFDLASRDIRGNETIIDGNNENTPVRAIFSRYETSRIDGFTITNGDGFNGGGIEVFSCSPIIANNTIEGNVASNGGGIYIYESSAGVINNVIRDNKARTSGGGLYLWDAAATIENNTISDNTSDDQAGGGIFLQSSSATMIMGNAIARNRARGGGAISVSYSAATIANNLIIDNGGGGILTCGDSPIIVNNTVVGNGYCQQSDRFVATAEAIRVYGGSPTIANTIIAFNASGLLVEDNGAPILLHNCVHGNSEYDYAGTVGFVGTNGNISEDPGFGDRAYGNLHIQPDSPCVDAGTNTVVAGGTDFEGQPRIQAAGGTVDMGADESDGTLWSAGPYVVVRVSPTGDDASDGASWATAKRTVQAGIDAAAAMGGDVWVAAGVYPELLLLRPYVFLYGGFAGFETDATQRDWAANVSVLDGQRQGSVITALSGHGMVGAVDGFTISNGNVVGATSCGGGGLLVYGTSPAIRHNRIINNHAGGGGGLHLAHSGSAIVGNTVTGNGASYGGAIKIWSCSPFLSGNTIVDNGGDYGAVYIGSYTASASPTIVNNIVAFNLSGLRLDYSGGTPILRHNCVTSNVAFDFSGLDDPIGTNGNFSADPEFADREYGNTHLQPNSPCVDAGTNALAVTSFDMDHQSRVEPPGGTVDIGADESDGTVWPVGLYSVVRVSTSGNDANDGSTWALAKRTVQSGIDRASASGGQVWVASGTYAERIVLHPYASAYGGFAGNELALSDRDTTSFATILDGEQLGSVVSVNTGQSTRTLDGFTITNGSATTGGGVFVENSFLIASNNVVTGNSGGGVFFGWSTGAIIGNMITSNSVPPLTSSAGGGIYVSWSLCTIEGNTITGNTADYGGGGSIGHSSVDVRGNSIVANMALDTGGGLSIAQGTSDHVEVAGNAIVENSAREGGGLYVKGGPETLIISNDISNNAADDYGGGMYLYSGSPTVSRNAIVRNRVTGGGSSKGGGLFAKYGSALIANNWIAGNEAPNGGGVCLSNSTATLANDTVTGNYAAYEGGGLYLSSSPATLANTLIAFNESGVYGVGTGTATFRHSCVFGNSEYDYAAMPDPTGTGGNVSLDPMFLLSPSPGGDGMWGTDDDVLGDTRLAADSPCVDAGSNGLASAGVDLDGLPRVTDGNGDGVATVDIGAYERIWAGLPGDMDEDGDVDGADYVLWADCLLGPDVPWVADCERADLDGDGDVDLRDFAAFQSLELTIAIPGDLDGDGDVDEADYAFWADCLNGPDVQPSAGCDGADGDEDGDVDLVDFAWFARVYLSIPAMQR